MRSEKKKEFIVVGLGEILWDFLPEGKQLGGAPANFVYHAQNLGAKGVIISAIGNDDLGDEILDQVKTVNLCVDYIARDRKHPTGTVSVELVNQGIPDYTIHENVAWDYIRWNPTMLALAKKADAVCFGSLAQRSPVSHETIDKFLKSTKPDCLRIYDVNLRQAYHSADTIRKSLERTIILKLNEDELPVIAKYCHITGNEERVVKKIIDKYHLKLIALTKGRKGSVLYNPDLKSVVRAPSVQVVDTVGAGDAFTAAFCIGLLKKQSLEMLHQRATTLAAYISTQKGAMPMYPDALKQE